MKKKVSVLVLMLGMMASFVVGTAAASGLQEIRAYLNSNISLKVDGEEKVITDASGVRTYPITYNDTTYLPVRSIASLLGIEVGWDQATQSVLLGKQPSGVELLANYQAYHFGGDDPWSWAGQVQLEDGKTEDISGVACSRWVDLRTGMIGTGDASASFNLAGKHDTLTFSYYSNNDAALKILGDDGKVLFEKAVTGGQVAQTVTIPLFKTSELTIEASMPEWETRVQIFNAYLDAE